MQNATADILTLPRIAAMATMPSRQQTLAMTLASILPQVDQLFLYLDNFAAVPDFIAGEAKITVYRAEEHGNLHASSRFLALKQIEQPSILLMVDDDIAYPPDYVHAMVTYLAQAGGRAVAGVHGRIFLPPHMSYVSDTRDFHFAGALKQNLFVHELGTGTAAFVSSLFDFDVGTWPSSDMDDILFAIEAQKRSIPRVALARDKGWLRALAENQPDSLWQKTRKDDVIQSNMMRLLLKLY